MKLIDLSGKKFGRLTVSGISEKVGRYIFWECKCECGIAKTVEGKPLRDGLTKSCGCLAQESRIKRNTTHGMSNSPEYSSWQAMWNRCTNESAAVYETYKSLTPPDEWKSFDVFLRDLGPRPKGASLDRIDNSLPYGPGNCRWATPAQQNNNTTRNIRPDGVKTLGEMCAQSGISYQVAYKRLKRGWPLSAAINPTARSRND